MLQLGKIVVFSSHGTQVLALSKPASFCNNPWVLSNAKGLGAMGRTLTFTQAGDTPALALMAELERRARTCTVSEQRESCCSMQERKSRAPLAD